jgi:RNA polymerase sigma-70 factor (ECF subfamily)
MAIPLEPSPVEGIGSPEALAELYRRHGPALFRLAYRLTGSRDDAEDVLHDVFVGLPEALEHYEERGRLDAWLRRVTARVALMRQRNARRRPVIRLEDADLPGASAHEPPIDLQAAVDALPTKLRSVLVLKEIEGYSHAEIAEMLDISAVASRVRLLRAMRRLRRILGGDR